MNTANINSPINIFISYRQFHLFVIKGLIREYYSKECVNIGICHSPLKTEPFFSKTINAPESSLKKIRFIKSQKKNLNKLCSENTEVHFFIPHISGLLSNYIFLVLKKKFPHIKVSLYYEGNLYLYKYKHDYRKYFKFYITRKISSLLSNTKFTFKSNILPSYHESVKHVYTPLPKETLASEDKIVPLQIQTKDFDVIKNRIVILGEKFRAVSLKEHKIIYHKIIDDLEKYKDFEIFYKDHPLDQTKTFEEIANKRGFKYIMIHEKKAIEDIIEVYKPNMVVSIMCSALVNLQFLCKPKLRMLSYVTDNMLKMKTFANIKEAFEKFDIKISVIKL